MGAEGGEVLEGQLDTWASTEYNVVVRMTAGWKYRDAADVLTEFYLESDLTDINEDITIEAPEGVDMPGLPEDIPLMDGATEVNAITGITSFQVPATLEEVTAFYQEAMPDNGWTQAEGGGAIPSMLSYEKDGRTATIMMGAEDGETSVTIMVE
jgi:hypothetical protein